jgi:hypothetical protein
MGDADLNQIFTLVAETNLQMLMDGRLSLPLRWND